MAAALLMDQAELPSSSPPDLYELGPDAAHWDLQFTTSGSFSGFLDELLVDSDQWPAASASGAAAVAAPPPPPPPTSRARRDEPLEALSQALVAISLHRKEFLAQVWAPATSDKLLLTTKDQPFCCDDNGDLQRYRALSTGYVFPVSQGRHVIPGLPGRVFTRLTPEWSPNVQFYDSREYLRVREAASCNVKGTLAVPVINPSSRDCIAVIELVAKVEKVDYGDEMAIICGALQAVNLSSSIDSASGFFLPEVSPEGREGVFDEISRALKHICRAHKLPLAQTWVPADLEDHIDAPQSSLSSSSSRQGRRLVARGTPYCLGDNSLRGFRQACLEQSLERGQGVAGRAFTSNQPSFVEDVRQLSIDEYPLVHYARYFKLVAAVGVRLRSVLTGSDDYVLEFFLPLDCVNKQEQQKIINELSITMQCACRGLRTLTNKELRQDRKGLVFHDSDAGTSSSGKKKSTSSREDVELDDSVTSSSDATHRNKKAKQVDPDEGTTATPASESYGSETSLLDVPQKRRLEKKRITSEKTVALEVLQKHFAGSLKDAAKSLGVCPTTLKRICRQYGIARWPSRKINKVSRSLEKLKTVIDSVEGIDRTVKLDALNGELARATANLTRASQGDHADDMSTICSSATDLKMVLDTAATPYAPTPLDHHPAEEMVPPIVKVEPRVHGCSNAFAALGTDLPIPLEQQLPRTTSFDNFTNLFQAAYPEDLSARLQQAEASATTVTIKVRYGSDTARFKLPVGFDYKRLRKEVSAKFKFESAGSFALKYLDDDQEWVMLNSDEDLNECLDVMKTTNAHTVKLAVLDVSPGNSLGSVIPGNIGLQV